MQFAPSRIFNNIGEYGQKFTEKVYLKSYSDNDLPVYFGKYEKAKTLL